MGAMYAEKGDTDQAIEIYNKARDTRPNDATLYHNMGNVYAPKGIYDNAFEYYTKSLEIRPEFAVVYTNLFELTVIGNITLNKNIEKHYIEEFSKDKESFMRSEMINIIYVKY